MLLLFQFRQLVYEDTNQMAFLYIQDAYLKLPSHSFEPFQKFCPYISPSPEVSIRDIKCSDKCTFVVIATDGVWDFLSCNDVTKALAATRNNTLLDSSLLMRDPSSTIIDVAIERICLKSKVKHRVLKASRRGLERRIIHDDMTVLVISL